jgi:hypothetical protein
MAVAFKEQVVCFSGIHGDRVIAKIMLASFGGIRLW